jgi:thiol-disulfide isomerase/thioredoxin
MKTSGYNSLGIFKIKFILLSSVLILSAACNMNPPVPVAEDNANMTKRMPKTNKPMPPINVADNFGWTLPDSKRKKLSDYQGKVLILDFWATYCPPCVEGTPHLVRLQNQYGKDGLVVIGLNVGGDEDKPKIADFIKQFNVQYDIAFPDDKLVNLYMRDDDRIPQTIVLDRQGRIVEHYVGFNKEIGAKMEEAVRKAIQ